MPKAQELRQGSCIRDCFIPRFVCLPVGTADIGRIDRSTHGLHEGGVPGSLDSICAGVRDVMPSHAAYAGSPASHAAPVTSIAESLPGASGEWPCLGRFGG